VVLEVQINSDGSLAWIRTLESPEPALAARLSEAVRRWRFSSSTGVVRGRLTFVVRRDSSEAVLFSPGQLAARNEGGRTARLRNGWTLPAGASIVSPAEFETRLRLTEGLVLDVRSVAEFDAAPSDAMNVPLDRLDDYLATKEVAALVFLDCTSGHPPNCALASWTLKRRGVDEVVVGVPADEIPSGSVTPGR
jgi:rhodanese-related sulfurtransferase